MSKQHLRNTNMAFIEVDEKEGGLSLRREPFACDSVRP